jgi:uncharacterized protein YjbJ (UPF0337 family)
MSHISQEVKGTAEQLVGNAKRRAGEFMGDPVMEAKGETREALGQARVEVAGAVGRVRSKLERAAQAVLKGISAVAGSTAPERTDTETARSESKVRRSAPGS